MNAIQGTYERRLFNGTQTGACSVQNKCNVSNQGTIGLKHCLFYRRMCVCVCGLYMKYMLNNSILLLLLLLLYLTEDGRYINFGDSGL